MLFGTCPVAVIVVLVQSITSMVVQRDWGYSSIIQVLYYIRGWLSKNANNAYNAYAVRGGMLIDNFRIHALPKNISEVVKYHIRPRSEHLHTKIKLCISLNLVDI